MKQIKLSEKDIIESAEHSSKGNQPKWFINGIWYKADHMGYEGLAEVVVSRLLEKSNITNFVKYYPVKIEFGHYNRTGCYSYNFLKSGLELVPLERLHRLYKSVGLGKMLKDISDVSERIKYSVDFVEETTKLENVGKYLTAMIEIDAFFLNEDRHTNNIAFIRDPETNEFSFCPYFDQGLSLLSDLEGFWLDGDTDKHIMRVTAKPFGSFNKQLIAAQNLYGKQLEFNFSMNDVDEILKEFKGYYNEDIIDRVHYIIEKQLEKF